MSKLGALLIASVALALLTPSLGSALPHSFGYRYINASCCGGSLLGNKAALKRPSGHDYTIPSGTFSADRIEAEIGVGLIQVGYVKTNGLGVDDCGSTFNSYSAYWEYRRDGTSDFHCGFMPGVDVGLDVNHKYRINQRTVNGNPEVWAAYIDNELKLSLDVNFISAALILAGGEIAGDDLSGNNHACYACDGLLDWKYAKGRDNTDWNTISGANWYNSDTWTWDDLPGGFSIHH